MPAPKLRETLNLERGIIAVAGAGGKKTILYALADEFSGHLGITTTVNCPLPPPGWAGEVIVEPEAGMIDLLKSASQHTGKIFFGHPGKRAELVSGVSPSLLVKIRSEALFDVLLVKADGARRRLIKAPGKGEPAYPPDTDLVLYVVSAQAFGRSPDSGIAHRVDYLSAAADIAPDAPVAPEHVARLLSSESGALKGLEPGTRLIPVINRADTPLRRRQAIEAARMALARTDRFDTVLVGCMGEVPLVFEAVTRS